MHFLSYVQNIHGTKIESNEREFMQLKIMKKTNDDYSLFTFEFTFNIQHSCGNVLDQ